MVKVFLSCSWEDRHRAHSLMGLLWADGFQVTLDWTTHSGDSKQDRKKWAELEMAAVRESTFYIGMFDTPHQRRGALCELGAALANRTNVIIVGDYEDACCFVSHPAVIKVKTFEEALETMRKYCQGFVGGTNV